MLYLAQVRKNDFLGLTLRLLAREEDENVWVVITDEPLIILPKGKKMNERLLVLVELSPTGEIEKIEEATSWVIYLVQTYLTDGIKVDFLQQEAENIEDWRQSLTLQNQDLARRTLELEAHRQQIQALEERLNRDKNGFGEDKNSNS
jgi:hypothetical protein